MSDISDTLSGKPRLWVKAKSVVAGMRPWFDVERHTKPGRDGRTISEQCFDSGVFTASELVRRLTGDDELALAIHEACYWRVREHESANR